MGSAARTISPHPLAIVQARRLSLFGHITRKPRKTDAKILTTSPLENWRRPPVRPRTMWMKTIQQDLKSNNLAIGFQKKWTWLILHSTLQT